MAIAISVWGVNVVFLIQGRLYPFMLMVLDQHANYDRCCTGA